MFSVLAAATVALAAAAPPSVNAIERLVDAAAAALTAPDGAIRGREVERFDSAAGAVQAIEAEVPQGNFLRRFVFLVHPRDPRVGPMSVVLTSDLAVDQLARSRGDPPPYFVDLYSCRGHATVGLLDHRPAYEELKAMVLKALEHPADAPSATIAQGGAACPFAAYVLPGLGPPPR